MKPKLNLNPCSQSVIHDVFSQLTPTTIQKIDNLFNTNGSNQTGPSNFPSNQFIEETWNMPPWLDDYREVTGEEKMNSAYLLSGGSDTMEQQVKEEPASEDMSEEEEEVSGGIRKTHWNDGPSKKRQRRGNSKNDYDGLSPADRERLLLKRERNKQAAARCRQRREDLIQTLSDKVKKNEEEKNRHLKEIQELRRHKMALEELLRLHKDGNCLLAQNKDPATNQAAPVRFPRPMSLNIPPANFPNLHNNRYTIDTPQSRLNAFDNISTGLSPNVELNAAQPFQEEFQNASLLMSNGKSMTVL